MDVKELNNSVMQMFLGKKTAQQSVLDAEATAKPSFADLVVGAVSLSPDSLIRPTAEVAGKAVETRPITPDNEVSKVAAKEERPDAKKPDNKVRDNEVSAKKEDKPVKKNKRKEKTVAENAPSEVQKPAQESQSTTNESVQAAEVSTEEVANTTVVPQEGATPELRDMAAVPVVDGMPQVMASLNGAEVVLAPQVNDIQALAAMPQIPVFDNVAGEVVMMSGEEFVQKVQEASVSGGLFVALEQPVDGQAQVMPAEVLADAESFLNLGKMTANAVAPETAEVLVGEEVLEQAQILDSKLKNNQKLNVTVEVEEENFASADSTSDLLADKTIVDDVILGSGKEKQALADESKISVLNQGQTTPVQATQSNQAQVNVVAGVAVNLGADVETTLGAEAAKTVTSENVLTQNSAQQSLNNAVASQLSEPKAAAKAEETSFRDVYKGMSREAVEQVKVNITKSAVKGVDKIEIQLKPEDLGHVQVKMQISKDGKLQAEIIASRQDTLEVLQKEVETLQKAFNDAGFDTDGGSFTFSFRGEEQQDENSELRKFIGEVMEQEASEELAVNDNQTWDNTQGVNIKV